MLNNMDLSGQKICITGATGFLGRHLVPQLLEKGASVRCLVRARKKRKWAPAGIETVYGDLSTGSGLQDAMENCGIIIHMAALLFGFGWQDYISANARAAGHIVRTFRQLPEEARPKKLIFVSSLAAVGPCATAPGIAETALPAPVSAYGWSKLLAEKILLSAGFAENVILRPPIIYGSGDRGLLPVFLGVKKGIGISPGAGREFPVSVIHARDAAQAICQSCSRQAHGIYHLGDGRIYTMSEFCRAMAAALGKSSLKILRLPLPVLGATAAISSFFAGAAARAANAFKLPSSEPPHWNLDKYREARQSGWLADSGRIRKELGFETMMDIEKGMAETVAGYRAEGLL